MKHAFESYKCAVCGTLESILTRNEECPNEPVTQADDIFTTFFKTKEQD